jgi:hypothetical protein
VTVSREQAAVVSAAMRWWRHGCPVTDGLTSTQTWEPWSQELIDLRAACWEYREAEMLALGRSAQRARSKKARKT